MFTLFKFGETKRNLLQTNDFFVFVNCLQALRQAKVVQTLNFIGAKLPSQNEVETHIGQYAVPIYGLAFKVCVF